MLCLAGPSLPVKTIGQLVRHAKAYPGNLNYGNAIGIGPQLVAELFKVKSGADIVHVPYRGGAPMIADLIAGQIDMTINGRSVLLPHIAAGKLTALAVTGAQRWPDLPTFRPCSSSATWMPPTMRCSGWWRPWARRRRRSTGSMW